MLKQEYVEIEVRGITYLLDIEYYKAPEGALTVRLRNRGDGRQIVLLETFPSVEEGMRKVIEGELEGKWSARVVGFEDSKGHVANVYYMPI